MRFDQFQLNFDLSQAAGLDRHRIVIAYDTPNNKRRRLFARSRRSPKLTTARPCLHTHHTARLALPGHHLRRLKRLGQ